MSTNTKPVAKSLHTVTVIIQVARSYVAIERYPDAEAVEKALELLGLNDRPDPYGLAAKALKLLSAS